MHILSAPEERTKGDEIVVVSSRHNGVRHHSTGRGSVSLFRVRAKPWVSMAQFLTTSQVTAVPCLSMVHFVFSTSLSLSMHCALGIDGAFRFFNALSLNALRFGYR